MLDLQKIDSGKMTWNKEDTNLKKLASTSIELFSKLYQEKGVSLILDIPDEELRANIDSDKINQVFSNLLSNAFKFTEQRQVTLQLKKVIPNPIALILDNDLDSLDIIENLLNDKNIKFESCDTVDQSYAKIKDRKRKFDLIITDVSLPKMDGIEHIKTIKHLNKDLPIIVISTKQNNIVLQSLLDYVVSDFIDKEIDPLNFNNAINKIFGDTSQSDKDSSIVEISLLDTGTGIPEHELDNVFERFHQVDNSETREKGGSGLGLAICLDIVEQHGGRLWLKSTLGKGSCFTFNLPLINKDKKPIGEILIEAGIATQEEINHALSKQQ